MQNQDQDRIDQLATQVRRLRWMNYGMAAVVAAGVMLAAGALQQASPLVKAKRIEIVSDDGKTVLVLDSDSAGGTLALFNAAGAMVATLESSVDGMGKFTTWNTKGHQMVCLDATARGEGKLTTTNGKGRVLVALDAIPNGGGGMIFTGNGKGQLLAGISASSNGEGMLTTFNGKGEVTATLP